MPLLLLLLLTVLYYTHIYIKTPQVFLHSFSLTLFLSSIYFHTSMEPPTMNIHFASKRERFFFVHCWRFIHFLYMFVYAFYTLLVLLKHNFSLSFGSLVAMAVSLSWTCNLNICCYKVTYYNLQRKTKNLEIKSRTSSGNSHKLFIKLDKETFAQRLYNSVSGRVAKCQLNGQRWKINQKFV